MSTAGREEVVITDLADRVIEGTTSAKTRRTNWRIVDYQLEVLGPGRGLTIGDWRPGPVTLRLGVEGHHRIQLVTRYSNLKLKLTDDEYWGECAPVNTGAKLRAPDDVYREGWFDTEEVYWREADLTGQDLVLSDETAPCLLAIRLLPIDPPRPRPEAVRWPMMVTIDGGEMDMQLLDRPEQLMIRAAMIPQDSCARVMVYGGIAGDICYHHTKVGTEFGSERRKGDEWTVYHGRVSENLKRFRDWGKNPAVEMMKYGKSRGWECFFYQRMGWDGYVPGNGCKASRFFLDHPEYHTVGPAGEKVMGLSVAHPEVIDHLCKFYQELISFGADGVVPCFCRTAPMVLYEPIMIEGFKKEYGKDAHQVPPSDPDWQRFCFDKVTEFMRRAKAALGGKRLAPIVHGLRRINRFWHLDVATWVREGIVDDLIIMGDQYDRHNCHFGGGPEHMEFDYFMGLPGIEKVRVWPAFYPYATMPHYREFGFNFTWPRFAEAMQQYMDSGAHGYGFWDATPLDPKTNIFDLGRFPRVYYKEHNRLIAKYELEYWDGYLWNRYSPVESS